MAKSPIEFLCFFRFELKTLKSQSFDIFPGYKNINMLLVIPFPFKTFTSYYSFIEKVFHCEQSFIQFEVIYLDRGANKIQQMGE